GGDRQRAPHRPSRLHCRRSVRRRAHPRGRRRVHRVRAAARRRARPRDAARRRLPDAARAARKPPRITSGRLRARPRPAHDDARYRAMANARDETKGLEAAFKPYRDTVKAIVSAGGRVVVGTDAPSLVDMPYGLSLHVELEQLVASGMTPFQALQAATLYAAEALGVADEIGTIEPGKFADLVFLGGDPLQDIRRTRDVRRVMRGGRIYDASLFA